MKTFLGLFFIVTPIFAETVEQSIISANNKFATDAYKELLKIEEFNFLVSPFSVETVLAFAQSGARGQTAEELRTSLHLPQDQNQIESGFKSILPKLKSEDDLYSLHSANKLYVAPTFTIKDGFKKTAVDAFGADLETVDFSKNVEAAGVMNRWVEERTNKKIQNLIDPDILSQDSVTVLINAVYFKGNWTYGLRKIGKKDFYQIDGKVVQTETIHLFRGNEFLKYSENAELKAKFLELEFEGDNASMVFVLPDEKTGLAKLEQHMDKVFQPQNFSWELVDMLLPKFKIETRIDFKKILQNLGVKKAFTSEADFSGIGNGPLLLSDVIQKTFIDLNEDGVEAAGSTLAHIEAVSGLEGLKPRQFHADHPFIFYIKINDMIVFTGRVVSPHY